MLAEPLGSTEFWLKITGVQGAAKNSSLKFFAVFSATAWNFNMEFYRFIYSNVLHLTAKWNMILLKNDEIIDF